MSNEKHKVHLVEAERRKLIAIVSKGQNKAVVIQRAHILLKVDEGRVDVVVYVTFMLPEGGAARIDAANPGVRFLVEYLRALL